MTALRKSTTALAILFILLGVFASHASAQTKAHLALRKESRELIKQQRYDDAIELHVKAARAATEDDAFQAYCLTQAAEIAQRYSKDTPRALALAGEIRDKHLSASQRLILLGQDRQYEKLIAEFGQTEIDNWPESVRMESYANRAKAWLDMKQDDKAAADLEKAVRLNGPWALRFWACYALGNHYESRKEIDKALQTYEYALNLRQASYSWRNRCFINKAGILMDRGQVDQVLADFETIDYASLPNDYWRATFYQQHAQAHIRKKNHGQAAMLLTAALRLPEIPKGLKTAIQADLDKLAATIEAGQ